MNSDRPNQNRSAARWRTVAYVLAATLAVLLIGGAALIAAGWRFYRSERPPADRTTTSRISASAETWSPSLGPGESAAGRIKRLGQELASLSFAPTNRPDASKVLAEAQDLAAKGRYEEALQRHIWYHNHALEYDRGQSGVRLSFALSSWMELARKFPKARQALVEIRDRDQREFIEGAGYFDLFLELSSINRTLQEQDETVAVFKAILKKDPDLAKQCYPIVEDLLVQKQEYSVCLGFIPDAQARFRSMRDELERMLAINRLPAAPGQMAPPRPLRPPGMDATLRRLATDRFVAQVRVLVEILLASGRTADAESIRAQALTVMDDPRLVSAILDAQKRLTNQVEELRLRK